MANGSFNNLVEYEGVAQNVYIVYVKLLIELSDNFKIGEDEGLPVEHWARNTELQDVLCKKLREVGNRKADRYMMLLRTMPDEPECAKQTVRLNYAHTIIATLSQLRRRQFIRDGFSDVFMDMVKVIEVMDWIRGERHCQLPSPIEQVMEQHRAELVDAYYELKEFNDWERSNYIDSSKALCGTIKKRIGEAYSEHPTVDILMLFGITNLDTNIRCSSSIKKAMEVFDLIGADLPIRYQPSADDILASCENVLAITRIMTKYNGPAGVKILSELLSTCQLATQDAGEKTDAD